jgi:hypothetical protein
MKVVGNLSKDACPINGIDSSQVESLIDLSVSEKCLNSILKSISTTSPLIGLFGLLDNRRTSPPRPNCAH